ncbi:hypothetical protein RCC89_17160 [Cytophagaceae bacterium ABcell3]|nr:hypothetical protein RCC89_17160 [Cytophagaceae bacterium ABcell3]
MIRSLLVVAFFCLFSFCQRKRDIIYCSQTLVSQNLDTLYLQVGYWGINGNNRLFVISGDTNRLYHKNDYDLERDYVFKGDFPIFIKHEGDSIFVYTYLKALEPTIFNSQFNVKQIEIDNKQSLVLRRDESFINVDKVCKTKID